MDACHQWVLLENGHVETFCLIWSLAVHHYYLNNSEVDPKIKQF